jgi:membrane dipeptidase
MEGKNLRQQVQGVHVDIPRLRDGGVGLQVFAAYIPPETGSGAFDDALKKLAAIKVFARSDRIVNPVETAAEARASMAAGKIGIMAAVENGLAIEESLEKLELLRREKVRIMTLVHSHHLPWIRSCTGDEVASPETGHGSISGDCRGLSPFGEQVIDAMNDLGMIPDLSHASESAFWDVIRRSKKPVIASHSCAWGICKSARNLKDDQLKALGDSGGIVGVNFFSAFLSEPFRLRFEIDKRKLTPDSPSVPMTIIADHIDYMVNIAGEDCIALGSDFDGIPAAPEGVTGSDFYPILETELKSRGYTEKSIEKIFNANFLRLLEAWD